MDREDRGCTWGESRLYASVVYTTWIRESTQVATMINVANILMLACI